MPVMELTMEQEFAYRRLEDLLPEANKDDLITVFMALQKQNYCLTNTIQKLPAERASHPTNPATTSEEQSKFGILLEIRDLGST